MSRHQFENAAEANEAAARLSNSPLPVLTSGARQRETDTIMEALLRECLKARGLALPDATPHA